MIEKFLLFYSFSSVNDEALCGNRALFRPNLKKRRHIPANSRIPLGAHVNMFVSCFAMLTFTDEILAKW